MVTQCNLFLTVKLNQNKNMKEIWIVVTKSAHGVLLQREYETNDILSLLMEDTAMSLAWSEIIFLCKKSEMFLLTETTKHVNVGA